MGIKKYRPLTPGLRFKTGLTFEEITKKTPEKALTKGKPKHAGRGAGGRISVRRKGGGHKREVPPDRFPPRQDRASPAKVTAIEYDPNRSAFIALVVYKDGEKRYILAPEGLTVGQDRRQRARTRPSSPATRCRSRRSPWACQIHNIELNLGRGGQMARSAGHQRDGRGQGRATTSPCACPRARCAW